MEFSKKIKNSFGWVRRWNHTFGLHPEIDWKILLGILLVATLGFLALGVRLYLLVVQEPVLSRTNDTISLRLINPKDFDLVLTRFVDKQQKFDAYEANTVRVIDPSL